MDVREFYAEFVKRVTERFGYEEEDFRFYPDGFEPEQPGDREFILDTNIKYSGQEDAGKLCGNFITIAENGNIMRFFADDMLQAEERTKEGGWEPLLKLVDRSRRLAMQLDWNPADALSSFEKAREKLFIRPLNYPGSRIQLRNAVYKVTGDIALVVYIRLAEQDGNLQSAKLPAFYAGRWGMSKEELMAAAMAETCVNAMPRLYRSFDEVARPSFETGIFMDRDLEISPDELFLLTLTTTRQLNGAVALWYPGVQKRLAELLGGSYYAVPTSQDEVHLHPVGAIDPRWALNSLLNVNKNFNDRGHGTTLSEKVYRYDAEREVLEALDL